MFNLTGGAGFTIRSFRLNSIFDPDQTGIGGQPTYFTELAAVYNRYKVFSADVEITFINNTAHLEMAGVIWHPYGEGQVGSYTAAKQIWLENPGAGKYLLLPQSTSNQLNQPVLRAHVDIRSLEGNRLEDDDYDSAFSTNPVNTCMMDLISLDPSGAAYDQATQCLVKITYNGVATGRADTYLD